MPLIMKRLVWVFAFAISGFLGLMSAQAQEAHFAQIKLTEAQITSYLKVHAPLQQLLEKVEEAGDKPDPELVKKLDKLATDNGFKSFDDLDAVGTNISFVLSGFDQKSGEFREPKAVMAEEIETLKKDKAIPDQERKTLIDELKEAIKTTPDIEHKENIALVKKHLKKIEQTIN